MEPKTLSATAIHVARLCLSRFAAEYVGHRGRGGANAAADFGTAVHGALELTVQECWIKQSTRFTMDNIIEFLDMSWLATFGNLDQSVPEYAEAIEILKRWYARNQDYEEFEVISTEVKKNFLLTNPKKTHKITFNYIFDRFDKLGPKRYRVMDYKTNKWAVSPEDLRAKEQPQVYALATQIEYPDAEEIWVEFDMLRHDGPVGTKFSRDDNIATWRMLQAEFQRILDTDPASAREQINGECLFCVKKVSCKALRSNIAVGGVKSLGEDIPALVDSRAELDMQLKAIRAAIEEMDKEIFSVAKGLDTVELESDNNRLKLGISSRRAVDGERVIQIVGPALAAKYGGGFNFTLKQLEELKAHESLDEHIIQRLDELVYLKYGSETIKVVSK